MTRMLARFKKCESIVSHLLSESVVSLMLHDACMYRETGVRELHMQKLSTI